MRVLAPDPGGQPDLPDVWLSGDSLMIPHAGVLLQAMPKAKGAASGGTRERLRGSFKEPRDTLTPTYASLHLDRKTAMVAQQLAALPEGVRRASDRRFPFETAERRRPIDERRDGAVILHLHNGRVLA